MVYQPLLVSKKSTVDRSMGSTIFENSVEGVFQQPVRPGFLVSPTHFSNEIVNIKALVGVSSNNAGQHVMEHFLLHWHELENLYRQYFQSYHDLFIDVCSGLGLDLMRKPEASLFATLKLPADLALDSTSVALELAEQHGIGVAPSTDFQEEGPAFLRLNFSVLREQIEPGLVRVKSTLQSMA